MPGASGIMASLYRVLINGTDMDPVEANFVHEIKITDFLRLPSTCALSVGYPAADEGNPYQALDDSKFAIGAPTWPSERLKWPRRKSANAAPPRSAAGSSGFCVYRPSKAHRPRVTTPPIWL